MNPGNEKVRKNCLCKKESGEMVTFREDKAAVCLNDKMLPRTWALRGDI